MMDDIHADHRRRRRRVRRYHYVHHSSSDGSRTQYYLPIHQPKQQGDGDGDDGNNGGPGRTEGEEGAMNGWIDVSFNPSSPFFPTHHTPLSIQPRSSISFTPPPGPYQAQRDDNTTACIPNSKNRQLTLAAAPPPESRNMWIGNICDGSDWDWD